MPRRAEPSAVHELLLVTSLYNDLLAAAEVNMLERIDLRIGKVLQESLALLSCSCGVLHGKVLKALTLIADHTCHVQPLVASLLWHSIAPKGLQLKDLDVRSLVHELLDRPLIHNVIVPASVHFEAIEASVLWVLRYCLGNLVQQLVERLS